MALVTRTFLDKTNTIVYGNPVNLGLNPILELYYGTSYTRGLIHFDLSRLIGLYNDKTYPNLSNLHHRLKMHNVAGLRTPYSSRCNKYNDAARAKSFDLVFFLIDREWDMGGGFDYLTDGYETVNTIQSTDGSNWYKATNTAGWKNNGIYDTERLMKHTIAVQHFDVGNESIDIDITDTVNDMILGKLENHGIGIAFCRQLEQCVCDEDNYVGFFTNHTHTFFKPCLETTCDDVIEDDRANFYLDKDNRLYFYASVGSKMVNMDNLPTCTIEGSEMAVKQATKGVYYVELNMESSKYEPETMHYDIWSNLSYNGRRIPDKELYFTTKAPEGYFSFGLPYETKKPEKIVPSIHGINHKERIEVGNVRKVNVDSRIAYTSKQEKSVYDMKYSIYSKADGEQINVIDWTPVERGYNENFFYINTNELVPGRYFIGIKMANDIEETIHNEICEFEIIDVVKYLKN